MDENKGFEAQEKRNIEQSELDFINAKRTYDTYQDLDIQASRLNQRIAEDAHTLAVRMFNNAITVDHAENMRSLGHEELAVDRQWNVDEVAELVANTSTFKDAIAAAVAAAVNAALARE